MLYDRNGKALDDIGVTVRHVESGKIGMFDGAATCRCCGSDPSKVVVIALAEGELNGTFNPNDLVIVEA